MLSSCMGLSGLKNFSVPIQSALMNDSYDGGALTDISVTSLIDSPRIKKLRKLYSHEVTEDASRRIASLLGTAFHNLMEEHSPDEWIKEQRFYAEVNDLMLSGQIDAVIPVAPTQAKKLNVTGQNPVIIKDYKVITAFKAQTGMKDYERQGNMYAYLLMRNGYTPVSFVIEALIKDWKESFSLRDENYPQLPIASYEYKIWDKEDLEKYVKERLGLHFPKDEDFIPECSDEEMWSTEPKYEAKKKGHTKATKLFDSERDANNWIADQDHRATKGTTFEDWDINKRPIERRRCQSNWCNVSSFCDQYQKFKESLIGT